MILRGIKENTMNKVISEVTLKLKVSPQLEVPEVEEETDKNERNA